MGFQPIYHWESIYRYFASARLAQPTVHGSSPLHLASAGGHAAAVQLLLRLGGDLNGGDGSGATPFRRGT